MANKIVIVILLIFFIKPVIVGQKGIEADSEKIHDLYISASFGLSFFGPVDDIESDMISSGFTSSPGPFTDNFPSYAVEARYYFKKKMGISINAGRISSCTVFGHAPTYGLGNYLELHSIVQSVSANLNYLTKNRVHNFNIGPAVLFHHVHDDLPSGRSLPEDNNVLLGLNLGYSLNMIKMKTWFLAIKTQYSLALPSEVGPYLKAWAEMYPSVFPETNIYIGSLNIELAAGIRLWH